MIPKPLEKISVSSPILGGLVFSRWKPQQKVPYGVGDWPLVDSKAIAKQLSQRRLDKDEIQVPEEIYRHMMKEMTVNERISKERARAIIEELAYHRTLYCPLKSELHPEQVVWIGIAITDRQQEEMKTRYREQVPLILTAQAKEEIGHVPNTLREVNRIVQNQIARMCVEAYIQGSVLTLADLSLIKHRSINTIGTLVNNYMVEHEVILPTAGTIKDAGRSLTHKHLVINMHMQGLYTTEIARKTYHNEAAVDRYLDLFNSVLILYIYDMPVHLMARVTGKGPTLIEEHLRLVEEHFPDKEAIKSYLRARGIKIA